MGHSIRHTAFMITSAGSPAERPNLSTSQHALLVIGLAGLCGVTALTIDMLLPAVAQMANSFQTTQHTIQSSLAIFVLVFGACQLGYGAISDRLGRRKPLFASLGIFALGSVLCAGANTIELLYLGRILQGVGACGTAVGFMSILRDCFVGHELARNIAVVMGLASLAPVFAPIAGAWAATVYSWRLSFLFLAAFALLLVIGLVKILPETYRPMDGQPAVHKGWKTVLAHPVFLKNSAIYSLSFLGLFAYLTIGAPILLRDGTLTVQQVGYWFACNAIVFGFANLVLSKVLHLFSFNRLIEVGAGFMLFGAVLMLLPLGLSAGAALMLPMGFITIGVACIAPASQSAAMEPFHHWFRNWSTS